MTKKEFVVEVYSADDGDILLWEPPKDWFPPIPVKKELIRCKDCTYYDKPHVEKDGERYEYSDLPQSAFDTFDTKLVTLEYGINFGGRCCIDYNRGYDVDKRVFVNENNYCGRAERKEE